MGTILPAPPDKARLACPRKGSDVHEGGSGPNRGLYRAICSRKCSERSTTLTTPHHARAHKDLAGLGVTQKAAAARSSCPHRPRYRDGILAAIRLGLSNARLEGLNSKVRLISHRSSASTAPTLLALIDLCGRHQDRPPAHHQLVRRSA